MRKFTRAITRQPPISMANGITTQICDVDVHLAREQHQAYLAALRSLDIDVTMLSPEEHLPDSHFVEDAAIIHNGVAILTRPGADERKDEVNAIRSELECVLPVRELGGDANTTVDGGDVLFMGNHVYIGVSYRTSESGALELEKILHEIDPALCVHHIHFDGVLHLKSGFVALTHDTLLGNPKIKLSQPLPHAKVHWLPENEGYAANALVANGAMLYFQECPSAAAAAKLVGLNPIAMDMSEFRKMDGSFTCLSLLW